MKAFTMTRRIQFATAALFAVASIPLIFVAPLASIAVSTVAGLLIGAAGIGRVIDTIAAADSADALDE